MTITVPDRIHALVREHGSVAAVARATGIKAYYLSRLRSGDVRTTSDDYLRRLGLRRVVTLELAP